ncbi:MAG: 3'-5' exonuclease, partial [Gemmatimonadaceae bacterium]
FIISAVDGLFPSTRSLGSDDDSQEERRLMYVAMTRARNHLSVVHPLSSYSSRRGADYSLTQLSRFVDRDVRATMEHIALGADDRPAEAAAARPASPAVDLRALLRGRFGG